MSHRREDAATDEKSGDAKRQKRLEEKSLNHHAHSNLSNSITDVAGHLHGLLQTKEKELKDREADFNRRVHLFETENPTVGKDNDVIQLNIGGSTTIAVFRRTLTQFQDSMLAAKFSGRWDDTLEKDRDGNFFVDQEPRDFLRLIAYLRLRNNRPKAAVKPPKPTYEFCSMLEYYELMPCIYAHKWIGNSDKFDWEEKDYGSIALSTKKSEDDTGPVTVIHEFGEFASAGVTEFTVEFGVGTTGAVGWVELRADGGRLRKKCIPCPFPESNNRSNSIFLSIINRKIMGHRDVLAENVSINHMESTTRVICKITGANENGEYSIEVVDPSPPGDPGRRHPPSNSVVATLQKSRYYSGHLYGVFPMISFRGNVTVSSLKYGIDQFPSTDNEP